MNDKLEINKVRVKVVNQVFRLKSKCYSTAQIGSRFNMSKKRISYILKNKVYLGVMKYYGKV